MDSNFSNLNPNPIQVFLMDDEKIFIMGLRQLLSNFPQLQLLDLDDSVSIWEQIDAKKPQLIVLEFKYLFLVKNLVKNYSNIPIFLLTSQGEKLPIGVIKELGIKGYAPKNMEISPLVDILIKVSKGESYWYQDKKKSININKSQKWLSKVKNSGLKEIDYNLFLVNMQLKNAQSLFDKVFWKGRKRELLAAKWLVSQLLPVELVIFDNQEAITNVNSIVKTINHDLVNIEENYPISVFNELGNKFNFNLENGSNSVLEIDILTAEKKQELLKLILQNLVSKINKIAPEITEKNIQEQNLIFLKDIWQTVTIEFFTNNYEQNIELTQYQIVEILQKELPSNFENILNYQHIFAQIIRYLILKDNLIIGTKIYNYDTEESREILAIILESLVVMTANATMQIILNNFGEETIIQDKLYQSEMVSLREIARFRNSLSLKYFKQKYVEEPLKIFEGEYELFKIENGQIINHKFKQINRKKELNELTGIRLLVTILLELRDTMSPVVRSFIGKLGKGLIFILTKIIGKGIGLIGRGIFEGLGNSLQNNNVNKKNN